MEESGYDVESSRVLWVAALTIALSEAAVIAVREVAVRTLHPNPDFTPLTPEPPILDTFLGTVAAIFVFVRIAFHPRPFRTWQLVAATALIVSFIPDVLLAISHDMGGGWPEAYALMAMHVVVWAICVTILPGMALTKRPANTRAPDHSLSILLPGVSEVPVPTSGRDSDKERGLEGGREASRTQEPL